MEISVNFTHLLTAVQILSTIIIALVGGIWVFIAFTIKTINETYKDKMDIAEREIIFLSNRITTSGKLVNFWEKSINEMLRQFELYNQDKDQLSETAKEFKDHLHEVKTSWEKLQKTDDPLIDSINNSNPYISLREDDIKNIYRT